MAMVAATLASVAPWRTVPVSAAPPCEDARVFVSATADRSTTQEIERRIATDESVAALAPQVHISTEAGVVTLRGAIENDEDRLVLASLAESAPGVRHVQDQLEVRRWHARPSASRAR